LIKLLVETSEHEFGRQHHLLLSGPQVRRSHRFKAV